MKSRWSSLLNFCCAGLVAGALAGPAIATELYDAARAKDAGRILSLLKSGANPNIPSPYDAPLHVSARFGPPEAVTALIEAGADVERAGYGGVRPLHAAALASQGNIVSILLKRHANVEATDNIGRTPLLSLVSGAGGNVAVLKILLAAGANPNVPKGTAPYHALDYAAMQGRGDITELLLAYGADVNGSDNRMGMTPLHYATAACLSGSPGQYQVVEILIRYGADVNAKDADGVTPLQYAKRYAPNNRMLHRILAKAGAKS